MALRSPTSSYSFSCAFKYDVFLSFRGSDTRYSFTGYLYKALSDRGIHTFFDDEELKGGDEIKPSLAKCIKESRIAIPVFSENYASSSFCLDELVTIIECLKAEGHLVLPVFYGMDPSHVRHQTRSYSEAIAKHVERFQNNKEKYTDHMERLWKWKMALTQAAALSGKYFIIGYLTLHILFFLSIFRFFEFQLSDHLISKPRREMFLMVNKLVHCMSKQFEL